MRSTIEDVSNFVLNFIESSNNKKLKEEWISNNTQDRLKKIFIKNDNKKPKKNKSAYLIFCDEMRPILKKKYPEFENKDIIRNLGLEWDKIKKTKKFTKYKILADKDKERYQKELQTYEKENYEEESDEEKESEEESDKEEIEKEESDKEKEESDKEEIEKEESDKENQINRDNNIENNDSDTESISSDILNKLEIIIRENTEKESFENFLLKKIKKMKKKYPDLEEEKIHKKIKNKWKKLTIEDKQKYHK